MELTNLESPDLFSGTENWLLNLGKPGEEGRTGGVDCIELTNLGSPGRVLGDGTVLEIGTLLLNGGRLPA